MDTNVLYFGDNLDVLRRHIPDESVDLIYLDPPFNSNRNYNILFKESSGKGSDAQIEVFGDTWSWGPSAQAAYEEVLRGPHQQVARMLKAMVDALTHNDVSAYLVMMAIRLIELRRVLKETGSIYLHCDPTAGHYLKLLMDSVFGPKRFRSEIIWKRTHAHSGALRYGPIHDVILFYGKSDKTTWTQPHVDYSESYLENFFTRTDQDGRRYRLTILTGSGTRKGESGQQWRGVDPTKSGRHWAVPGYMRAMLGSPKTSQAALDRLDEMGRVVWPKKVGGVPSFIQYQDDLLGVTLQDVWTDIPPISAHAKERLGYPTQKPLALLERIIEASSNEGDVVLDPFCGCGTAVHGAQNLGRKWIGIDITHLAIGLIRRRLVGAFPDLNVSVIGEPVDIGGARELAARDKYQFQWWALDRIGAQPVAGKKKGADKGIDGVIPYVDAAPSEFKRVIVSVKGGEQAGVSAVRDLIGVMKRENEPIGVLVTLNRATKDMQVEATTAGHYENELWKKSYPRVQILTAEDILAGKRPEMPPQHSPFAKAPVERERAEKPRLL